MSEIRIYVEGGGDRRDGKSAIRTGFGEFLADVRNRARERRISWYIIACGSVTSTIRNFAIGQRSHPDAFNILLVDSDNPVVNDPWTHLEESYELPSLGRDEKHCHLMVQVMETWLIADPQALRTFYGPDFNSNSIPARDDVENLDKETIERALETATRNTQKGTYHKIRHAPKILANLNERTVREKAAYCDRLFNTLSQIINSPQ